MSSNCSVERGILVLLRSRSLCQNLLCKSDDCGTAGAVFFMLDTVFSGPGILQFRKVILIFVASILIFLPCAPCTYSIDPSYANTDDQKQQPPYLKLIPIAQFGTTELSL